MRPTSISRPSVDWPTTFIDDLPAPWNPEDCSEKMYFLVLHSSGYKKKAPER